ncbi:MAG: terminase small subunit [Blastomonas sp.]|uniref:terminase small subunit n=1 Tax=Blastomonas sp. TaxID=1909299 RepID=UPI00406A5B37|nr:terminase small subunit [Blastomonas sp.]
MLMAASPSISEPHDVPATIDDLRDDDDPVASSIAADAAKPRFLTDKQRLWARHFVLNGGNANEAARSAGFSAVTNAAYRMLVNPQVMAEVRRLGTLNMEAALPRTINRLIEIMENPATPAQAAVNAAIAIMDRAGLKPKSSPLVAIQNNTYNQASGSAVQQAIAEIWAARDARLSDIAGGMPDKKPRPGTRAHYRAIRDAARAEQGDGGGVDEGSPPPSDPIPGTPPAPEPSPQDEEGGDDEF